AESLRQAAGSLARACRKHRVTDVAAIVPAAISGLDTAAAAEAIVTGFLLGSFKYEEYKGAGTQKKDKDDERLGRTTLTLAGRDTAEIKAGMQRGRAIADGQNFARTIASRPGNVINPPSLAEVARAMAR